MIQSSSEYYCNDNLKIRVDDKNGVVTLIFDSHPNKVLIQLPLNKAWQLSNEITSELEKRSG